VGVAAPFQLGGWHRMLGLTEAQSEVEQHRPGRAGAADDRAAREFCQGHLGRLRGRAAAGRGRDIPSFLYLFMDTFVGGGLVINSHLHRGLHGNAGAVASLPSLRPAEPAPRLISQASLWELEQRFREHGLDPMAAYDKRVLQARGWNSRVMDCARCGGLGALHRLGHRVFGSGCRGARWRRSPELLQALCEGARTRWPTTTGKACTSRPGWSWAPSAPTRALGGALLPLHACFAPDTDIFLKA
jgi:predicted NBD/HSP70 family sugar kinase